jgi:D-sedoheptulose 7-phosphate isomerase
MTDSRAPLRELYPFLHGDRKEPTSESKALLDSVRQKVLHGAAVAQAFFEQSALSIVEAAGAIASVYRANGKMLAMGNGGSSCDAAHFAVEFLHPITTGRPSLPALNLVMDTAMLSAVGNDVGIQHVFRRQVEAHGRVGDGLIGFSTSGNSVNLTTAYRKAKEMGMVTLGLSGGDGGEMKRSGLVDHCLVIETDSVHRVQEVQVATYHLLWDLTHTLLADDRGYGLERAGSAGR